MTRTHERTTDLVEWTVQDHPEFKRAFVELERITGPGVGIIDRVRRAARSGGV